MDEKLLNVILERRKTYLAIINNVNNPNISEDYRRKILIRWQELSELLDVIGYEDYNESKYLEL